MNIYSEINGLPQLYYEWKLVWGILGSQYYNKKRDGIGSMFVIISIWKQLKAYYEQDGEHERLSDDEKAEYAKNVDRMKIYCEKESLSDDDFNRDELKELIDKLTDEDKKELEWQIDMYKRGRYFTVDMFTINDKNKRDYCKTP